MKKVIGLVVVLTLVEQVIKLLIVHFCMDISFKVIPNILLFSPVQNTNLLWVADLVQYQPSIYWVNITQFVTFLGIVLIYRYVSYIWENHQGLLDTYLTLSISGVCCSFIDVVFWGGSLDYIRLFDWFTFDLKDVFLTSAMLLLIIPLLTVYTPYYYKLSKDERKQQGMWYWIKEGIPTKRRN